MQITRIAGGVLNANTYVISANNGRDVLAIDPTDAPALEAYLESNGLNLCAVLLTHGHFDHTCGLQELLARRSVAVYLHPGDANMLSDPMCNAFHLMFPGMPYMPIESYIPIENDQELMLSGLTVKVISTPGHSKGSVCYLIEDALFSGDTLFQSGFGRTDLWGGDQREMIKSLRHLRTLPADTVVYPGHGGQTTIGAEL